MAKKRNRGAKSNGRVFGVRCVTEILEDETLIFCGSFFFSLFLFSLLRVSLTYIFVCFDLCDQVPIRLLFIVFLNESVLLIFFSMSGRNFI